MMKTENIVAIANRLALAVAVLLVVCLSGEALIGTADLYLSNPSQNAARAMLTFFEIAAGAGSMTWIGLMLWVSLTPAGDELSESGAQASVDARRAELEKSLANRLKG